MEKEEAGVEMIFGKGVIGDLDSPFILILILKN
jgi:hypothetical protein